MTHTMALTTGWLLLLVGIVALCWFLLRAGR